MFSPRLQNQASGLEPCSLTGDIFVCRAFGHTSMAGRMGASRDALVCESGSSNPVRFCHQWDWNLWWRL